MIQPSRNQSAHIERFFVSAENVLSLLFIVLKSSAYDALTALF